ncbi:MAG: glycosyltransferase family 2 protein [Chthonomonas sp.]|nr:glycosyltransferase family 2 protein [Chthonomonas sp.]
MSDARPPDVSIIVPALNEAATIGEVITRLLALPLSTQIVVVNDGSRDKTGDILAEFADRITVITNPEPGGKGMAIRTALKVATGEVVVIQDADLEYDPAQIPSLIEPILAGTVNVVYGSRFMHGLHPGMALPNKLVNLMLRGAVRLLFGTRITDEATCYKALRRELLQSMDLQCHRFEFCPEVTAKALRLGETIREVPITYEPRNLKAGKKIRWTDAPEAFATLWKYRKWRK